MVPSLLVVVSHALQTHGYTFKAPAGDDERVRIWDIETLVCLQVIRDPAQKWGQITCVNWLSGGKERDGNALCLGTGRGFIVVFRRTGNVVTTHLLGVNLIYHRSRSR